ncbi:hypothetical protein [Cupriavidus campinensis]|uniref:Uncharacterized protein n=1 Tax=Cupriavidus campinensis TaxID=151783 RepID=A0ABY3ESN1_9BURK|nr:hypothetical protein [Cupriavidus campinensis]TSP13979.1 hypothetical protein FGG12_05780 [Cupriavidus campinensis]
MIAYYTAEREAAIRAFFEERRHGALSWLRQQIGAPTRPRTDDEIMAGMDLGEKLDLHACRIRHSRKLDTLKSIQQALLTEGTGEIWLEVADLQALR